jgi:hypothetical protein
MHEQQREQLDAAAAHLDIRTVELVEQHGHVLAGVCECACICVCMHVSDMVEVVFEVEDEKREKCGLVTLNATREI